MFYEAPKRMNRDRIAAISACAPDRRPTAAPADPDTDPAAALLLRVDPSRAATGPAALLTLADAALRSPR